MFFRDEDYYTGPRINDELIKEAERTLGVKLPQAYLSLLGERNGGVPVKRCVRVSFKNSWADDHVEIDAILGVSGTCGIDNAMDGGSRYMIREWGYPDVGVVFCSMPSGGHTAVMLDYSECGSGGEPSIIYVDDDRTVWRIAENFNEFLEKLVDCREFRVEE